MGKIIKSSERFMRRGGEPGGEDRSADRKEVDPIPFPGQETEKIDGESKPREGPEGYFPDLDYEKLAWIQRTLPYLQRQERQAHPGRMTDVYRGFVRKYTDERLVTVVNRSDEESVRTRPSFYDAVIAEMLARERASRI